MKLLSAILPVVALVAATGQVEARNCRKGLVYCGSTLRSIATGTNYDPVMAATGHADNNDLFDCTDDDGNIRWVTYCYNGCVDSGRETNDYCRP
ncbi:uncharacterized protein EV422DRAFT_334147 [Fimicolochytrium jonesii]|uniref:uncharacterized protein n=1 Tax=Fimicolochytrium jonesii TaxID=1396493 RepID=UPI0022FE45C2|nr:uncharacterized protein EV422DRAFT_334147 [Fimicolochytrium jonesii]KAI8816117.1 hypothetical protein EV422DRAFT_334147 [Fimicolochytrium jonesii]